MRLISSHYNCLLFIGINEHFLVQTTFQFLCVFLYISKIWFWAVHLNYRLWKIVLNIENKLRKSNFKFNCAVDWTIKKFQWRIDCNIQMTLPTSNLTLVQIKIALNLSAVMWLPHWLPRKMCIWFGM